MINRALATVITEDGQAIPVTTFLDDDGDECEAEDAVICIAGPDRDGMWRTLDLTEFEGVRMQ